VTGDAVLAAGRTATVALDPGTGDQRWRRAYRERRLLGADEVESVQVGPVAVDGRVLTGASVTLYTHAADGSSDWAYRTNSSFSTVLAVGNTVFITSLIGDTDRLVALSLETGLPYWRREGVTVPVAFAPDAGYLLTVRDPAGADDGTLQARDPASGAVEWTNEPSARPAAGRAPLAVDNGRVYAARGPVYALDAATGEERWRYADGPGDLFRPVTDGDRVYAFGDGTVALDAATGDVVWRTAARPSGFGSPAVAGDRLYLPTDSAVLALDTADGSRAFEASLPSSPSALAVAGGRLYARTERSVVALEGAS
jgi:outer membrane protein assembly factor BamB